MKPRMYGHHYAWGIAHALGVIAFLYAMVNLGMHEPRRFVLHMIEDGGGEYMQFTFYLLACGLCLYLVQEMRGQRRHVNCARLFGIASAMFFVIAMEEVSWLQRVLLIGTPDYFNQVNYQSETNIHNINRHALYAAYFLTGVYGMFSASLYECARRIPTLAPGLTRHHDEIQLFIVAPRFIPYFVPLTYFYALMLLTDMPPPVPIAYDGWRMQEAVELLFATGCYFTLFYQYRHCRRVVGQPGSSL